MDKTKIKPVWKSDLEEPPRSCYICNTLEDKLTLPCLTCDQCHQAVHVKCLKRKSTPGSLHGDIFFTFVCSNCSFDGTEIITRQKISWFQVIILVLFDLTNKSIGIGKQGYFHWKMHIATFIDKNWDILFKKDFKKKKQWIGTISGTLSTQSPHFFRSGSEALGEAGWWKPTLLHLSPGIVSSLATELLQYKHEHRGDRRHTDLEVLDGLLEKYSYAKPDREKIMAPSKIKSGQKHIDPLPSIFTNTVTSAPAAVKNTELYNGVDSHPSNFWLTEPTVHSKNMFPAFKENSCDTLLVDQTTSHSTSINIEQDEFSEDNMVDMPPVPQSLFNKVEMSNEKPWLTAKVINVHQKNTESLTPYSEAQLYQKLTRRKATLTSMEYRLLAKLRLRLRKREKYLPLFNIDNYFNGVTNEESSVPVGSYLDRYQRVPLAGMTKIDGLHCGNFLAKISGGSERKPFLSPYTNRLLKPYIRRDFETTPLWLKLMHELQIRVHKKTSDSSTNEFYPVSESIDYCYVRPEHIPSINALCELYFWPGIDMSETLQYPDFSCVVLYKKIVVGFAFMIPDISYNECYISYILTRPEWRRCGIATFMLYHLVQTCMGNDITLHVSATNPAVILYQKFGFKIEEFIQDFYEKYLPNNSKDCKHALFLRLTR